jgi:hypothetical protein
MKLKSTYSFLEEYFNYTTSENRIYGRAVSEAMIEYQSLQPADRQSLIDAANRIK